MKEQSAKSKNTGKKLIVFGFVIITILFLLYHRYQDPELITPDALNSIERITYGFYITLVAAFGAIAFGMYRYHKEKVENKGKVLWTEILTQVNHDELIYKLTLKYLRRDGYDIGNHKIPEVKKFIL